MDAQQVGEVVDKLADKIGIAAEKIQPIAEETVRQVSCKGMIIFGIGAFLLLIGIVALGVCYKTGKKALEDDDYFPGAVISGVVCLLLFVTGMVTLLDGLILWIAPLPHIFGL